MITFGQTVQILDGSSGARSYGGDTRTWPVKSTLTNVVVAPAGTNELVNARETVAWDLDLYLPPDSDVDPVDRVIVGTDTFEVFGQKQEWDSPFSGWEAGGYVRLVKVTG